jgi:hypothetical protein
MCVENTEEVEVDAETGDEIFIEATHVATSLSTCDKHVTYNHSAGCVKYSALGLVNFLNNNVWFSGTLMVLMGLFIGLFGQKYFHKISGAVGSMFAVVTWMILASIFQWMNNVTGFIICIVFAIGGGIIAYWIFSEPAIATTFLCIGGGLMIGSIIEGLIIAATEWESMLFYVLITILCMTIGGIIGYKSPLTVTKYLTAVVGSYLFMRGLTYFFGGYPSEMEMYDMMATKDSDPLKFTGLFWIYVGIFAGGIIAFVTI